MANILPPFCVSLATMMAIYTFAKWLRGQGTRHILPLPPGPKGLPLIGNLRDLPPNDVPEHERWLPFKDRYGPLSSITVPGQTMILIHDREVAVELMEKRANRYSERMYLKFGNDMCGWGNILASLPYGASHRLYRKYTYRQIGTKAALFNYQRLQEGAVGRFLSRLSRDDGCNLVHHLNSETAEIILEIVYGYTVDAEGGDPLLHKINEALRQVSAAFVPGKWAVDMFPALEHIPDWFPGAGFRNTARYWNQTLMYVINVPFELVKTQMSLGHARTSFVSKSIEQARHEGQFGPDDEHAIKWAAGSMYAAGADTSVSIMTAFFLAMSMFPDVQKKAQEEIDRVVGTSRLPTFSDRENLPYINAVVEEAQRWHPILPLGLPHVASREDSINGFRIPAGAILLPAVWWFTRDPATHHEPEKFKPERFLEPYNEPSATNVIFGFGRRICPGKTLADATLFITIAQSLAALSIQKAVDEKGQEIEPDHVFGHGIIALPGPFKTRIAPRNKNYEDLIEKAGEQFALKQKGAESLKDLGSRGRDGAW